MMCNFLFLAVYVLAAESLPLPPSLKSLQGDPQYFSTSEHKDPPVISNFYGTVGSEVNSVIGLSQVLLPPYCDEGVKMIDLTYAGNGTRVPLVSWTWSPTSVVRVGGYDSSIHVETRMLFEDYGVLLQVRNSVSPLPLRAIVGGGMKNYGRTLGWAISQSHSVANYTFTTYRAKGLYTGLLSCSQVTPDCSLWAVNSSLISNWTQSTESASFEFNVASINIAFVVGDSLSAAISKMDTLLSSQQGFTDAWKGFEDQWEHRWLTAFDGSGDHYSGRAPVLENVSNPLLSRLYYVSLFSILQNERTNLPLMFPRVYVTASGNAVSTFGAIGGTDQFAWDQSFYGVIMSLLDPEAVHANLLAWNGRPINANFAIELDNMELNGYFYAYNAISLYRSYSSYLRTTKNQTLLTAVESYLEVLASFWKQYAKPGSVFADYSGDPNNYLECVPTYTHVVAGLQSSQVHMMRDLADLRSVQGNTTGAHTLRQLAKDMARQSIEALYSSGTGYWHTLNVATNETVPVRHVIDFAYAALGFCYPRPTWPCDLNGTTMSEMNMFAWNELVIPSKQWMRALSLKDSAAPVQRPDHGSTGAYDAWPAMTFDSLTYFSKNFTQSIPFLFGIATTTLEGPFGQAKQITADGTSAFKTIDGLTRYAANNGGAYAESILRTVFGYDPVWKGPMSSPFLQNVTRSTVTGVMRCIRDYATDGYLKAVISQGGQLTYSEDLEC